MSGITALFDYPFFTGVPTTDEVPGTFQVALNGRPYILDLKPDIRSERFARESIQILRTQSNITNLPDETSINPADLWRRAQDTWHKGAGQKYLDRQDSDPARYHTSLGVDPWTKWQLSLLNQAAPIVTAPNDNLYLTVAGTRLYYTKADQLRFVTSVAFTGDTEVTGGPATNPTSLCTNGNDVWTSHGASGIYATTRMTSTMSSYVTGTVNLVRFCQGRLMAAAGPNIYNITTGGALPTALKAMANTDWVWTDITDGPGYIYFCGFSGDKSLIYGTTIKADGTALDEPVVKGALPDGEIIRCMQGYLGFLIIGTDMGVRFCTLDGQGNISLGPLVTTETISVRALEPQDRFVWFGWSNYDSTHTGLGRIDLSVFTAPLSPAYASDLMATQGLQGVVQSAVTYNGVRVFATGVDPNTGLAAIVVEDATQLVTTGEITSGAFTYGIPDPKVAMYLDVRMDPLAGGQVAVYVSTDGGDYALVGTETVVGSVGESFPVGSSIGRRFETKLVFTRDASTLTITPVVTRHALRSYAAPNRGEQWTLPILLHETVLANGGVPRPLDIHAELNLIRQMVADRVLVTYQEGDDYHLVFVEDYVYRPHHPTADFKTWNGICVVTIKEVSQ